MLLYLLFSILFFLIIYSVGFAVLAVYNRFKNIDLKYSFIEYFFAGFLFFSLFTSYLSILFPLNSTFFICCVLLGLGSIVIFRNDFFSHISCFRKPSFFNFFVICFILLLVLFNIVEGFKIYDTGLYHVQAIKWISEYSVVPGLGNLHGRFAFNSMFFPINAVFSINDSWFGREILIYPLNFISAMVFVSWQYSQIKSSISNKNWTAFILALTILIFCLTLFYNWFSSPSPDIICTILIVYTLQWLLTSYQKINDPRSLLVIAIIFLCITYKLSSIFLILACFTFIKKETYFRALCVMAIMGFVIALPFVIRNYYLSGYIIYPFPGLDIFNVGWKIPLDNVALEKSLIESWSKIPYKPYHQVLSLSISEWFPTWLSNRILIEKFLMIPSLILPCLFIPLIIKKNWNQIIILFLLLSAIVFWFITAPDPRFAYGFFIFSAGFISYISLSLIKSKQAHSLLLSLLILFLAFIAFKETRVYYKSSIKAFFQNDYTRFIYPNGFSDVPDFKLVNARFDYYVPAIEDRCYNQDLPCAPVKKKGLILRKKNINDGFKIKESEKNRKKANKKRKH